MDRIQLIDKVELELIVAAYNLDKVSTINLIQAIIKKKLLDSFSRSDTRFLLNNHVFEVCLDGKKIKQKIKHLRCYVIIAYFVCGKPSTKAM